MDAARIDGLMNHPMVFPWVSRPGDPPIAMARVVRDPRNVVLLGAHGGIAFHWVMPGLYDTHTAVLPLGRGAWAEAFGAACRHWMFTRTDAVELLTKVPRSNMPARALTRRVPGGTCEYVIAGGWTRRDGRREDIEVWGVRIQDWLRHAPELVERGREFHRLLHLEYDRLGLGIARHDDNDVHDRFVGAAVEMILAGLPAKGVVYYNRWAAMVPAPRIKIESLNPLVIDVHDCRLLIEHGDIKVI